MSMFKRLNDVSWWHKCEGPGCEKKGRFDLG